MQLDGQESPLLQSHSAFAAKIQKADSQVPTRRQVERGSLDRCLTGLPRFELVNEFWIEGFGTFGKFAELLRAAFDAKLQRAKQT